MELLDLFTTATDTIKAMTAFVAAFVALVVEINKIFGDDDTDGD